MSFSGLKTAMLNLDPQCPAKREELPVADLAASFSAAVSEELVPWTMAAAQAKGYGKVAVVGGVAANSRIRRDLEQACQAAGCTPVSPAVEACGDNGSMIGSQGYYEYLAGTRAGTDLNAYANREISWPYGTGTAPVFPALWKSRWKVCITLCRIFAVFRKEGAESLENGDSALVYNWYSKKG